MLPWLGSRKIGRGIGRKPILFGAWSRGFLVVGRQGGRGTPPPPPGVLVPKVERF